MIEIFYIDENDINDVAELSFMVGKMHDDALPKYFNKTTKAEHLRIIENMIKDENAQILVAKNKKQVVGFACLCVQKNERKGYKVNKIGYIYNFGVDESFRRKGIGKKLVESAIDYFKDSGCEAVDLNVFMFNRGALEFYKSLGFEVIDVNLRKML